MKTLLIVKSVVECLAGLALALFPSMPVSLLLGSPPNGAVGIVVCRIGGTALLTMGIACWWARNDSQSRAATGLIVAMLVYDVTVVVILILARFAARLSGIGLWPAVALHSGLGFWSLLCLTGNAFLPARRSKPAY
jgi:hypothetical protein